MLADWKLPGNIVPPVTPFDEHGRVDVAALRAEIDDVIAAARPAAICVAGVERFLGVLIREAQTRGLAHIFTTMEVLFPTLILGASGGTMPAPGAAISALLVEAFRAGDLATAAELHALHSEMPARWVDHGLVAVMKVSLRALGIDCGETYPPFGTVPAAHVREIEAFWADATARFPALRPAAAVGTR